MFFFYKILINIFLLLSPLIILVRIFFNKEHPSRFLEKYCIYKKKNNYSTIWFHGASVGEIQSVIPIIEKLEKNKKVKKILLTSSTLSSSTVISKYKFKKTQNVFFPIDSNFLVKKFINFWKPQLAIFIDSEIWPNTINNLDKKRIPIILINARMTKKSYKKWIIFKSFAKKANLEHWVI